MSSFALPFKRLKPLLGTFVGLSLNVAPPLAMQASEFAFEEAKRLEKIFNFFDPESELSKLNQRPQNQYSVVSPELYEVLSLGEKIEKQFPQTFKLMPGCIHEEKKGSPCYQIYRGAVRRLSACVLDLGGIAKGYIVDMVFEKLAKNLGENTEITVNAGGDLRCSFSQKVEIRIPGRSCEVRFERELSERAIATSSWQGHLTKVGSAAAKYEATCYSPPAASATVIAARCSIADAFTKVALFSDLSSKKRQEFSIETIYRFDEEGLVIDKSGFYND